MCIYADDTFVFLNIDRNAFAQYNLRMWGLYHNLTSFHLHCIFLQTPLGLDYKDCLIIKNEHYSLPGVQKTFPSLRELTSYYQHAKLLLAEVPVKLGRCCPPRPKGMFPQPPMIFYYYYTVYNSTIYCKESVTSLIGIVNKRVSFHALVKNSDDILYCGYLYVLFKLYVLQIGHTHSQYTPCALDKFYKFKQVNKANYL